MHIIDYHFLELQRNNSLGVLSKRMYQL